MADAEVRFHNPPAVHTPVGYSHIAEVVRGRLVFISGQVPLDSVGNIVGVGDFREQAIQVYENLKAQLAAVGGDFSHVVKFGIYVTDMQQIGILREVRDSYINLKQRPTSTLVAVNHLFREDVLLEIEATAVLPL